MNPPVLKVKRRLTPPTKPVNSVAAYDYHALREIGKMSEKYQHGGAQSDSPDSTINDESFSNAYSDYKVLQSALPVQGIGEVRRRDDNWITKRRKKQAQM